MICGSVFRIQSIFKKVLCHLTITLTHSYAWNTQVYSICCRAYVRWTRLQTCHVIRSNVYISFRSIDPSFLPTHTCSADSCTAPELYSYPQRIKSYMSFSCRTRLSQVRGCILANFLIGARQEIVTNLCQCTVHSTSEQLNYIVIYRCRRGGGGSARGGCLHTKGVPSSCCQNLQD